MEVVEKGQRTVNHVAAARGDFGPSAETGKVMADVGIVLFDGESQILASEQLLFRDQSVIAFPVVSDEGFAFDADFIEKFSGRFIITPTQFPGQSSPCTRIIGSPDPKLVFFPLTKCHISFHSYGSDPPSSRRASFSAKMKKNSHRLLKNETGVAGKVSFFRSLWLCNTKKENIRCFITDIMWFG